jgi:tetratricopeptide (TPR) repeat protein
LQARGETRAAIAALEQYTSLKPRDTDALRQLANLWGSLANKAQQEADVARAEATQVSAAQTFAQPSGEFLQAAEQNRIAQALATQANARADTAGARAQAAAARQQKVYESLTLLVPEDPSLFLSLGIASQEASDYESAIAAYKKFLELAPNDPSAPQVKQQIAILKQQLKGNSLLQQSG